MIDRLEGILEESKSRDILEEYTSASQLPSVPKIAMGSEHVYVLELKVFKLQNKIQFKVLDKT